MFRPQKTHDRMQPRDGNLDHPQRDGRVRGVQQSYTIESSAYTRAAMSPVTKMLPFVAAGLVMAAGARRWRGKRAA